MTTNKQPDDQCIEQEIRQGRTFSLADVIGKEAGNFMKGASPIPKLVQVQNEILGFMNKHLDDPEGALHATLRELVLADDVSCCRNFDSPLVALEELLHGLLEQETVFQDFVRRVDMKWGQMYGDRPHFERPGHPPHPEDAYTFASVRVQLTELLSALPWQKI